MGTSMIDARGWKATYKGERGSTFSEPLVFWVLDGDEPVGYMLSHKTGRPVPADRASNFEGYERDDDADAAILPAEPGWWIVYRDSNAPDQAYWAKVVAWRVTLDGFDLKAIGAPADTGEPTIESVKEDHVRFVFEPTRIADGLGSWPGSIQVVGHAV